MTTIRRGRSPCLACLFPETPPRWKRQFPVFGAVSGAVACMGAMEAIKVLADLDAPLYGRLLTFDLRSMRFKNVKLAPKPGCPVCGAASDPK